MEATFFKFSEFTNSRQVSDLSKCKIFELSNDKLPLMIEISFFSNSGYVFFLKIGLPKEYFFIELLR